MEAGCARQGGGGGAVRVSPGVQTVPWDLGVAPAAGNEGRGDCDIAISRWVVEQS